MIALSPETAEVLHAVGRIRAIEPYTLVGGTALALRLQHRSSQDLDFAIESRRLDRRAIDNVIRTLERAGFAVTQYPCDFTRREWENQGFELDDSQQDFNVGGVKLSFFIPEFPRDLPEPILVKRDAPVAEVETGSIRVLNAEALALMKSLLLVKRTTTRDLFDLVALVRHGVISYRQVFDWQNTYAHGYDYLRSRLLHAVQPPDDPGVQPLDKALPSDFTALQVLLASAMDEYEQQVAAEALAGKTKGS
ncbi:MAG: nucleotidyl transferase AbiEii/AbiGii toxin family protein [Gammaproteobacteria bacterium]